MGVMTAIDDFLGRRRCGEGREFGFAEIPAVFGPRRAVRYGTPPGVHRWADLLLPYHQKQACFVRWKINRLRNYLRVLEMQD